MQRPIGVANAANAINQCRTFENRCPLSLDDSDGDVDVRAIVDLEAADNTLIHRCYNFFAPHLYW